MRAVLLPVLECRSCGSSFVPAPLAQRSCDGCNGRRARAREEAAARKLGYWRAWNDRRLDAVSTDAEGDA